jgi:hypothetical protein
VTSAINAQQCLGTVRAGVPLKNCLTAVFGEFLRGSGVLEERTNVALHVLSVARNLVVASSKQAFAVMPVGRNQGNSARESFGPMVANISSD